MAIKVLLHSGLAPGDTLMMTCGVRDLVVHHGHRYAVNVATGHMRIWDYNPHIAPAFKEAHIEVHVGPGLITRGSHTNGLHYANGFRLSLEAILNIKIPQGPLRADLHLSEEELARPPRVEGHYWVLMNGRKSPGRGKFTSKTWPPSRWQEVIDALPWITFVQAGNPDDTWTGLRAKNLIDLTRETFDLRELMLLFYHSQGSLGLVSLQMHMAAAFKKPCVVIAGAREPMTFEAYPDHRFLHFQGSMKCNAVNRKGELVPNKWQQGGNLTWACWRDSLGGCGQKTSDGFAKCIDMVRTSDVVRAIESYYEGGRLEKPNEPGRVYIAPKKPVFRAVGSAKTYLGGEQSICMLMRMMEQKGYVVEFVLKPGSRICEEFRNNMPPSTVITKELTSPCDILLLYANDWVYEFKKRAYSVFANVQAERKVMCLNYRIGNAGGNEWSRGWDLYLFLNEAIRSKFKKRLANVETAVLAPPVDLEEFLKVKIVYKQGLHLLKHSSQGDQKHPSETEELIRDIRARHGSWVKFSFMPAPTFLPDIDLVHKYSWNEMPVPVFLALGNCFWYPLKPAFGDMGPRAIVEAMAAGLPVIADNRGGARDRITDECGWLCDSFDEYATKIAGISVAELSRKGQASRQRAIDEFDPAKWVDAIIGG